MFFLVGTLLHQPLSWDAGRPKIFTTFIFQYFELLGTISPLWLKALQWLYQALNWVWKWVVIEISCKSGAETQFFSPKMKIMPIFWWSSFFLSKGICKPRSSWRTNPVASRCVDSSEDAKRTIEETFGFGSSTYVACISKAKDRYGDFTRWLRVADWIVCLALLWLVRSHRVKRRERASGVATCTL